jgi:hypothetical protein
VGLFKEGLERVGDERSWRTLTVPHVEVRIGTISESGTTNESTMMTSYAVGLSGDDEIKEAM